MAWRPIPEGSTEIQTGLWASERHFTIAGTAYMRYELYAAEGYCFWNKQQPENYDEDGNVLPLDQRKYLQFASTAYTTIADLNANYESVPYQDSYELLSGGITETA